MAAWRYKISPNSCVEKIFRLFVVLTYACELHFWHDLNRNFISLHSYAQVYGVFNTKAAQTPKTWKPWEPQTESLETSDNYHLKVLEAVTNVEKQWKK